MSDYQVGQDVQIFERITGRRDILATHTGHVAKVGRKYGTAEYMVSGHVRSVEFDLADGKERGFGGDWATTVRTVAQMAEDRRYALALSAVKAAGIEFRFGLERRLTLRQIEALAEVVKDWEG